MISFSSTRAMAVAEVVLKHLYIDVVVGEGGEWRLTGIYGEPSWDQKDQTWQAMRFLKTANTNALPWLVVGDFNEILHHHEKEGAEASSSFS